MTDSQDTVNLPLHCVLWMKLRQETQTQTEADRMQPGLELAVPKSKPKKGGTTNYGNESAWMYRWGDGTSQ